jgi:hypothetical protein
MTKDTKDHKGKPDLTNAWAQLVRQLDMLIRLRVPSCPLSFRAFGPRKLMKIGFSTLW